MKHLLIITCLALLGCGQQPPIGVDDVNRGHAQDRLDDMVPACRDGVEYLVTPAAYAQHAIAVPHLKPDGRPFTCFASGKAR